MKIDVFEVYREKHGDLIAQGPEFEYLQWHTEQDLNSVWWTAKDASLNAFADLVESLSGEKTDELESTLKLFSDKGSTSIPVADALAIARKSDDNVDFLVIDSPNGGFSLSWISPASFGREAEDSPHGEISLVTKQGGNSELIVKSIELTATPHLGRNALRLVNELQDLVR